MTASAAVRPLEIRNPATGEVLGTLPVHTSEEVAKAVNKARHASEDWAGMAPSARRRALLRFASYLVQNSDELTDLVHRENGKPVDDAYLEFVLAIEHLAWAAKNAEKILAPKSVSPGLLMANFSAKIEHRPLGVVGVIGPWNYPVYTPLGSVTYALAAGNTVVFKPSEYTTLTGNALVEAFYAANPSLPRGIFETVNGFGATGAALVSASVDKLAFTGSTATAKKIMAAAAETLTPVLLECGGKDAVIVAEDADINAAADAVAFGAFANSGQTCIGVERVYVVRSVRDEFLAKLEAVASTVKAGKNYGPMTMASQIDVVREHITDALASGGTALVGGPESVRPPFIDPVVIVDADENSLAVREETFGPTVTVTTVDSVDEAINLANANRYGLASSVFSRSNGEKIARRLKVGATTVNAALAFGAIPTLPFGGVGDSGIGRIHGEEGLLGFTRTHSIATQRFAIPGMALLSFGRSGQTMAIVKKAISVLHGRYR